jgi:tetratricopeptide (TPR) repeat protein
LVFCFQVLLNTPTKIFIPAEGKELPEGLPEPIVSLPPNPSVEQLQTALKTLKPTCAGIVSEYSCGNHDTAPAYNGEIISVNAGDEVAMNTMIISIVDIDGSGNGSGLIKVPMMNNIKIGVALSGIKVAKGGCIVAGKAETSGIDVAILNEKQRQNLAKAYEIYKKTLDIAEELAPEIAKGINDVKDYFEALKAKKEATRKLLAQSNLEDLSEVLNNCAEIVSQSRVAQDSLEKTICLIKTGKAKGNIAKLEKASKANIDFINKLGPALAQCQSKPQWQNWEQTPCKGGPCVEFDYSEFECKKELNGVFGVEEESQKNYHVSIDIATEKWLDGEGKTFYKTYIDCAVKEIKEWTYFDVKLNKIEKAGRIYPFQSQSTLPNQNSFEASKMELPMAGEWGNNLFSIGSTKIDDYIFLGRVLHFCPNVEPAIKAPWTRWFKGAKTTAESADFAESIKTISDYTFAIVDGYYICKSIGAAAWRLARVGEKGFYSTIGDVANLFNKTNPTKAININGKIFGEVAGGNGKTTKMFEGATDAEIRQYAEGILGKPLTAHPTAQGVWNGELNGTKVNLRNVSSSNTGAKWTIDVINETKIKPLVGQNGIEIKFK